MIIYKSGIGTVVCCLKIIFLSFFFSDTFDITPLIAPAAAAAPATIAAGITNRNVSAPTKKTVIHCSGILSCVVLKWENSLYKLWYKSFMQKGYCRNILYVLHIIIDEV